MAAARYAPLSINPRFPDNTQRELDGAFEDADATECGEITPLTEKPPSPSSGTSPATGIAHAYDFERDYDHPPPGSPPRSSSVALPNAYGNSNGFLSSSPIVRSFPHPSFFRRAVGTLLPLRYQALPTSPEAPWRGGGTQNDGVFANVVAKPVRPTPVRTEDGDIYMTPEVVQTEAPPSYAVASADAAPSYWETTVHIPSALNSDSNMIVDELPTGPVFTFILTTLVSWFFQLPGFILCFLLSSTHAGRFGSQAGLALTLIQFGFGATMSGASDFPPFDGSGTGEDGHSAAGEGTPTPPPMDPPMSPPMSDNGFGKPPSGYDHVGSEWISFLLMTIGWFLLLMSIIGYLRVKRFEMSIRASSSRDLTTTSLEDRVREETLQRSLEEVFSINVIHANDERSSHAAQRCEISPPLTEEARLERALRESGFI